MKYGIPPRSRVGLAVDSFPVPTPDDQDRQTVVFYFADHAEIAQPVSPQFTKAGALEGFSHASRVVETGHTLMKKFQNPPGTLHVELASSTIGLVGYFNLPCYIASGRLPGESFLLFRRECVAGYARPGKYPRVPRGAEGRLRGHRNSWCVRCAGPVLQDVFQLPREVEWLASLPHNISMARQTARRREEQTGEQWQSPIAAAGNGV